MRWRCSASSVTAFADQRISPVPASKAAIEDEQHQRLYGAGDHCGGLRALPERGVVLLVVVANMTLLLTAPAHDPRARICPDQLGS